MNERNNKSMDADLESIELDEPERIEHLSELDVGDRVVWGGYDQPRTVVQLGVREKGLKRNEDAHVETPIVKVTGDRDNSKTHILAHRVRDFSEGEDIIAVEQNKFNTAGKIGAVAIVRTHIGGSRCRVSGETEVVA